jgi:hypothetical protein
MTELGWCPAAVIEVFWIAGVAFSWILVCAGGMHRHAARAAVLDFHFDCGDPSIRS